MQPGLLDTEVLEVDLAYKKKIRELHMLITMEYVVVVNQMVMSWYDRLWLTVVITTKYKIARPGVFKFKDLGWYGSLPPEPPRVVGVRLPEEIVELRKFPLWELARRLLVTETSLAEVSASSTPHLKLTEGYTPRHKDWGCQGNTFHPIPGQFNPAKLCTRDLAKIDQVHPWSEGQDLTEKAGKALKKLHQVTPGGKTNYADLPHPLEDDSPVHNEVEDDDNFEDNDV